MKKFLKNIWLVITQLCAMAVVLCGFILLLICSIAQFVSSPVIGVLCMAVLLISCENIDKFIGKK